MEILVVLGVNHIYFKQPNHASIAITPALLRSQNLITGFKKELQGRWDAIQSSRLELEKLYGQRVEDSKVDLPEHNVYKEGCMVAVRNCESAFNSYGGTLRSIKGVIDAFQNL